MCTHVPGLLRGVCVCVHTYQGCCVEEETCTGDRVLAHPAPDHPLSGWGQTSGWYVGQDQVSRITEVPRLQGGRAHAHTLYIRMYIITCMYMYIHSTDPS